MANVYFLSFSPSVDSIFTGLNTTGGGKPEATKGIPDTFSLRRAFRSAFFFSFSPSSTWENMKKPTDRRHYCPYIKPGRVHQNIYFPIFFYYRRIYTVF